MALTGLLFLLTLGMSGSAGMSSLANRRCVLQRGFAAILAGALFNLANILLVAAIDGAAIVAPRA